MKRCLTKLVVFLLLGAIVNVGVAWGITALTTWPGWPQEPVLLTQIEWPRPVPQHWPSLADSLQGQVFGWSLHQYLAGVVEETPIDGLLLVNEQFVINVGSVGWPCLALQWELWLDHVLPRGRTVEGSYQAAGQPADTWWLSGIGLPFEKFGFGLRSWKRLPVRPIWPGFAINTIFYAAILWMMWLSPFVVRRVIRRKRGHCLKCGYDLRGAAHEVCPECGWRREPVVEASQLGKEGVR